MPNQDNPEINIFEQYVRAVFVGAGSVVIDYANIIMHPLDNLLYPVANLAYDATIIAAGHEINSNPHQPLNGDFVLVQRFVAQNPQAYTDAVVRMQRRVNQLKALGQQFVNGTGPQRVEMAVHTFGHILAPGFIIKGIKSVANLNLATRINPPRFVDMYQDRPTFPHIPQNTLSEIRATTGRKNALYVITTDKKLLIAFEQQPLGEGGRFLTRIHHNELGRTKEVLNAGEVLFRDGQLIGIDTNAGRYCANGPHLKKFTEKAFIKYGLKEAKDRFFDLHALHNDLPLLPPKAGKFLSPYLAAPLPVLQGLNAISKEDQKQRAQKELVKTRMYDSYLNPFAHRTNLFNTPSFFNSSFNTPFRPYSYSYLSPMFYNYSSYLSPNFRENTWTWKPSSLNSFQIEGAVRKAVQSEMQNLIPNAYSAYLKAAFDLGIGHSFSFSDFCNVVKSTNLLRSYNLFNPDSTVRDVENFCLEIGGVATDVGIIKDLINSEAHALASDYYLCFAADDFLVSPEEFQQLAAELKEGIFKYKTFPFFSLHFNIDRFLYPVIHPAYKNTLVGVIIAFLDYWMKGFANGGIFDENFLKIWHETSNCDENYLRARLVDLKKYCKENCKQLNYVSLRELLSRMGLKNEANARETQYDQPFMTSFRIISYLKEVKVHGNVLIPIYDIRVEYDIDMRPDYREYVESHLRETGSYPEEYEQIKSCYEIYAQFIRTKMREILIFKKFFNLLGVMNSLCYLYATLDKMGKEPVLDSIPSQNYSVPKAFPPLPVRYFRKYPMEINLQTVFAAIQTSGKQNEIDKIIQNLFSQKHLMEKALELLNQTVRPIISKIVNGLLAPQLPANTSYELNDEEIDRITNKTSKKLIEYVGVIQNSVNDLVKTISTPWDKSQRKALNALPTMKKIQEAQEGLKKRVDFVKARWKENPILATQEIYTELPEELHEIGRENFKKTEQQVEKKLQEIANKLKADSQGQIQKAIEEFKSSENKKLEEVIKKLYEEEKAELAKITAANETSNKNFAEDDKAAKAEIAKLTQIKNNLVAQINQGTQNIAQLTQNKAAQVAKFSALTPQLRALNQSNVNAFCAQEDQKINKINGVIGQIKGDVTKIDQEINKINGLITQGQGQLNAFLAKNKERMTAISAQATKQIEEWKVQSKKIIDESVAKFTQEETADIEKRIQELNAKKEEFFTKARRDSAVLLMDAFYQDYTQRLNDFLEPINHFTGELSKKPKVLKDTISKQYTHQMMTFTSAEDFIKQTGDNFKIVGGCHAELNSMQSTPIEEGEVFCQAVTQASSQPFSFRGKNYAAPWVIKVRDKQDDIEELIDTQSLEVLESLNQKQYGQADEIEKAVSPQLLTQVVGKTKAPSIHYASALFSDNYFEELIKTAPGQINKQDHLGHFPAHIAAGSGNVEVLVKIITRDRNQLEAKDAHGATPLIVAVEQGQIKAVEKLLMMGANVNHRLPNGLFPLYLAIQNNFSDIALLLVNSSDISRPLDSKMTSLHLAIACGLVPVALCLIEKGAKLDVPRHADGFTPFHMAVKKGHLQLVKAMVARGVSIHLSLESKKTALHIAADTGHKEIVTYLIAQDAKIDEKTTEGDTPLMLAIKAGHLDVAEELAQKSAINTTNKHGQTASLLAIQYGMSSVSDILINGKENPQLVDKNGYCYAYYVIRNGDYPRVCFLIKNNMLTINQEYHDESILAIAAHFGHFLIVNKLQKEKARYKDKYGFEIIHYAVMVDEIGILRRWLEEKNPHDNAMVSAGENKGKSLAYLAARHGSKRCLEFLLTKLTTKEIASQQLLLASLESRNAEVVDMILKYINDVNEPLNADKDTALHIAVRMGSRDTVELLLKRGSDLKLRNCKQQTPFHIAVILDDEYLLKRLFKLSLPKEWPHDLLEIKDIAYSPAIKKTIKKYYQRLPSTAVSPQKQIIKQDTNSNTRSVTTEQMKELAQFIMENNFDAAADLLEEYPTHLCKSFETQEGLTLLQLIFAHIPNYPQLLSTFKDDANNNNLNKELSNLEIKLTTPINRLLTLLKRHNIVPIEYLGEKNVLLSIIGAETDKGSCYRFELFQKYFPESITILANDKYQEKYSFAELALHRDRRELFNKLEVFCTNTREKQTLVFSGLHEAVSANKYELVKDLLRHSSADITNQKQQTALMIAAANNNIRMMQLLLSHGASPNKVDRYGLNAVHHAIENNAEDAALFILTLLRNKNPTDRRNRTALHLAAKKGLLAVARYICEPRHGQECDDYGQNALHVAAFYGKVEIIDYLVLKKGFEIDQVESPVRPSKLRRSNKRTALHIAAHRGHADAVVKLITLGADPNKTDKNGDSVREYAVFSRDSEMLRVIEQLPSYHDKTTQSRLLFAGVKANNKETVNELIIEDVNLNVLDEDGHNALHLAALYDANEVADVLIEGDDIDVDLQDQTGYSPLHIAATLGRVRMVEILLNAGAEINKKNHEGLTPLFVACEKGHLGVVSLLLKYEADFTVPNPQSMTPAHIALLNGHINIVSRLVASGDKSLHAEVINKLSSEIKEKILIKHQQFLLDLKPSIHIKGLLVQHGIYRDKIRLTPTAESLKEARMHFQRGCDLFYKKEYQSALNEFNEAILLNTNYVDPYCAKASCYREMNDLQTAITIYNKATCIDPDYRLTYYNRSVAYAKQHDYHQALIDVNKFLKYDDKNASALAMKDQYQKILQQGTSTVVAKK